jgi:predicted transposase YbfD/YdcC
MLHRQIRSQFQGKRKIPFMATDHEIGHGRDITWTLRAKQAPEHIREAWIGTSWIVEVAAAGTRDSKPFQANHVFLTSLRTSPEALLQLVRDRWSIEGLHWIRDTQLHEDAHRYRGNGAGVMATLRTADEPVAPGWVPVNPGWRWRCAGPSPTLADTLNQPWPACRGFLMVVVLFCRGG